MALSNSKMIGLITVTTGTNDTIDFYEEDGDGGTATLSVTLDAGEYYPGDTSGVSGSLCEEIKTKMDAASTVGNIYTVVVNSDTGLVTISCVGTGSSPKFYPKLLFSNTQKFLTGGDSVTGGNIGLFGRNHFGWNIRFVDLTAASSHTSDFAHSNSWYPNGPDFAIAKDNPTMRTSTVTEAVTNGGDVTTYDFSGDSYYLETRELEYRHLDDASKEWYLDEFWQAYAKQGLPDGRFRFYKPRDSASFTLYGLTGDSLRNPRMERTPRIKRWNLSLTMRKYKS